MKKLSENQKLSIAERVKTARGTLSQSELAKKSGCATQSICEIENAGTYSLRLLKAVIQALGASENQILTGEVDQKKIKQLEEMAGASISQDSDFSPHRPAPATNVRKVPVISWARAGEGGNYGDLEHYIGETVSTECQDPNCFALIVEGDSMSPDIKPGYRIVVMPNVQARTGDIVVARLLEGGEVFLKHFKRNGPSNDDITLGSFNPDYPDLHFKLSQFRFIYPVHSFYSVCRRA